MISPDQIQLGVKDLELVFSLFFCLQRLDKVGASLVRDQPAVVILILRLGTRRKLYFEAFREYIQKGERDYPRIQILEFPHVTR